jgi:hypothetical protein
MSSQLGDRTETNIVIKYRDVIRMTLFGRHDKNINYTTSIYQGFDRYALTTIGGGVNSISVRNIGTIGFTASPSIYISNATNIIFPAITTTLSTTTSTLYSIAVSTGGTGWASAPTVFINGTGTGATATVAVAAGAITATTMINNGSGYTGAPNSNNMEFVDCESSSLPARINSYLNSVNRTLGESASSFEMVMANTLITADLQKLSSNSVLVLQFKL